MCCFFGWREGGNNPPCTQAHTRQQQQPKPLDLRVCGGTSLWKSQHTNHTHQPNTNNMATPHQSQHQCTLQTEATLGTSTNNATPISLATQSLSAATAGSNQQEQVVAARSASGSVLLLDAHSFQPKQLLSLPPPLPPVAVANAANTLQQPILGVVLSPSGTHIAAYAADRLLLAQCASKHDCTLGQLDNAARIPAGIRSVHWSPCGRVLAVCSKTQVCVC